MPHGPPFLIIDNEIVYITTDSGEMDQIEIGDRERAFNGELLVRLDTVKRIWNLSTEPLTYNEWDHLKSTVFTPGTKVVIGEMTDHIGYFCNLQILKIKPIANGVDVERIIQFQLHEI